MTTATTSQITAADRAWAEGQFEAAEPTQEYCRAFDASADGTRYLRVTGMTMWENLGAQSLPADAGEPEETE